MNQPFIIWTMRRTGGTSLGNILGCLTEQKVEHEPFNWDRSFGNVTKVFQNNRKNFAVMKQSLEECCITPQVNVKHCYELVGQVFNAALVELFAASNYKHIVLTRKNELLRLLSLYTAKYTSVWGKHGSKEVYKKYQSGLEKLPDYDINEMQKHARHCAGMTHLVQQKLIDCKADIHEIYYEDLFTDSVSFEQRKLFLKDLCQHIGLDVEILEEKENDYKHYLMKAKQNDTDFYHLIPNLDEIKAAFPGYSLKD